MKPLTNAIIQSVSNLQLVSAMRLIQSVEQPPYIPVFEVVTLEQAARYFGTQKCVLDKLYCQNRMLLRNFTDKICSADVEPYALEVDDFGKTYSFKKFLFVNGVSTTLSYSKQLVFDARAILMFAILIVQYKNEIGNGNAEKIYSLLENATFSNMKNVAQLKPWYCYNPDNFDVEGNSLSNRHSSPLCEQLYNVVKTAIGDEKYQVCVKMLDSKINIEVLLA